MAGRFESMLATAIALGARPDDAPAQVASWRQIVDILAQSGPSLERATRAAALARLGDLRDAIPASERRLAANSLAGRTRDADVIALFAADAPGVAAPLLARTDLDEAGWRAAIPAMPPASRNILRNRRDLPQGAVALLAHFAPGDLALPLSSDAAAVPSPGVTPIRELVDRIAAYRDRVPQPAAVESADEPTIAAHFVFETTLDGVIDWIEGAPREAIIGVAIGEMAAFGRAGVDGQAAGAFRRRAPFRDARLRIEGDGAGGGDWLISGAPLFNPRDGRFCGYRGDARRPLPGERVGGASAGGVEPDSLRQLVHELRTPLNAIHGFAQMIDQQLLGPAATGYRERARDILGDAERLTAMVDDLDTMARLDSGRVAEETVQQPDIAAMTMRVVVAHRAAAMARGVELTLVAPDVPLHAAAAASPAERMIARLLAATAGVAVSGESLVVELSGGSTIAIGVSRPLALVGRDEAALLDPGFGPDGDWPDAPLLGLGFTLRLVARLAAQAGGALRIDDERFVLTLPAAAEAMVGPAGLEPAT